MTIANSTRVWPRPDRRTWFLSAFIVTGRP
jgi:hypothetical protein